MITRTLCQLGYVALWGCVGTIAAAGQKAIQPVSWSLTSSSAAPAKPGRHITLDLTAHIDDGWHVYALHQAEGGPTPLRITVDPNGLVDLAGEPSGTSPMNKHDQSFDLDTETFEHLFTLHVPVLVKRTAGAADEVALNVRYQACNDRICLPPKVVHVTISVKTAD